jgi:hypothetical protein
MPHMTQRNRKLIGAFASVISIFVWAWLGTWIYLSFPADLPWYVLLAYFIVAGLGWMVPAMALIRWMARPDDDKPRG